MRPTRATTARRGTALAVLVLLLASGCRADTVRVTFRPAVGATYRYEVSVRSRIEVRLPGEEPEVHEEQIVLQSEHTVLDAGPDGVRVQVILGDASGGVRTFVVRFDRAAQLDSVEADDDSALSDADPGDGASVFGLSEIFPAAAGAPPDRRLGPGERWTIDDLVIVPSSIGDARLTGEGRLVELGIEGGEEVARLATSALLEVRTSQANDEGEVVLLDGEQQTEQRSSHDLDDGAVRSASSTTDGAFSLEIRPPLGELRDPVRGSMRIHITSRTVRLD